MKQPYPWLMKSAEVRICGNTVSVSVHGLTVRCELTATMAAAVWAELGVPAGRVSVQIHGPAAGVSLVRGGIQVRIGPYTVERPIGIDRYWEFLRSRQEIEMDRERLAA